MLRICQEPVKQWFLSPRINRNTDLISENKIEELIAKRNDARKEKNWKLADQIRDQLKEQSVIIEDQGDLTSWIRK